MVKIFPFWMFIKNSQKQIKMLNRRVNDEDSKSNLLVTFFISILVVMQVSCIGSMGISDDVISGHVYDADTKQPLSQAFVYCQEVKCSKPMSNGTGYWATGPCFSPSQTYTILCTRHGYETLSKTVETDSKGNAQIDFFIPKEMPKTEVDKKPENVVAPNLSLSQMSKYTQVKSLGVLQLSETALECDENGRDLYYKSQYEEAIQAFDKAIRLDPNLAQAWHHKGWALRTKGNSSEALNCFDEAIRLNPNLPEAWMDKGNTFADLGKYEEAIRAFDEAISLDPKYMPAWFNKGRILSDWGKYDKSIQIFNELIRIDNGQYGAYKQLAYDYKGKALKELGRNVEADEAFAKVRELGYNG